MHPPPLPSLLASCVCFLEGFPGSPYVTGFLSCSSGLPIRRSPACLRLELFLSLLSFRLLWFPGSLIPLRCLTFRRLVSIPVCPMDSYGLDGFILRTLRWCSAVSLLFVGLLLVLVRPVLFLFSVSFCPFLGALLSEFSSFLAFWSPLGSPFRSIAMSSGLLFAAGSVFLPSLPGWSVRSPGSPRLWRTPVVRGALARVVLVLCLRFVSIRFSSFLPLLLLRYLAAWLLYFPLGRLLHSERLGSLIRRWFP